ncbi:hypothetical protein ACOMHN_010041 [Nucella lapillus]
MLSNVNNKVISDIGSDEDTSHNGLLEPALVVADDCADTAFDLDIPPVTGSEYLRRVREEAKKCPKIVVSDLDTSQYTQKQTVSIQSQNTMPAPRGFAPLASWVKMQLEDFVALRQKILKFKSLLAKNEVSMASVTLPQAGDMENWCRLCFGRLQLKATPTDPEAGETTDTARLTNDGTGTPPLLSIVVRMDQPTVISVLEYHVNWLEATGFTHKQGQWFYSLLAVLQKPLTPESCSWLRQLARICSVVRATLAGGVSFSCRSIRTPAHPAGHRLWLTLFYLPTLPVTDCGSPCCICPPCRSQTVAHPVLSAHPAGHRLWLTLFYLPTLPVTQTVAHPVVSAHPAGHTDCGSPCCICPPCRSQTVAHPVVSAHPAGHTDCGSPCCIIMGCIRKNKKWKCRKK